TKKTKKTIKKTTVITTVTTYEEVKNKTKKKTKINRKRDPKTGRFVSTTPNQCACENGSIFSQHTRPDCPKLWKRSNIGLGYNMRRLGYNF
ncbi:MAG: hypothetical protein COA77_09475, partial [Thaumarchaeota archaeon]